MLRCFITTGLFCLHEKFQVYQSSYSRFLRKNAIFFIQFVGGNIFPTKYLRFYTSQKKNYQIWIIIEQKLGIYFSKLENHLFQWIAP